MPGGDRQAVTVRESGIDITTMSITSSAVSSLSFDEDNISGIISNEQLPYSKSNHLAQQQDLTKRLAAPKIDFHAIPVLGRSKEVSLLAECYKRVIAPGGPTDDSSGNDDNRNNAEIVLISGVSGTGKTKLAGVLREPVTMQHNGYFVSGKFDHARKDPFSGLVEAFSDLCDLVAQDEEQELCVTITETLRDEVCILNKIIPNLSRITGRNDEPVERSFHSSSGKDCFTRFKLACRKFLNTIASRKNPIVLLLDDLHWADEASIDVIQSLVTDKESKFLLIIGTHWQDCRNTVKENSSGAARLVDSLREATDNCLRSTRIHLDNFDLNQVVSFASSVMKMYPSKTTKLAELILKRTRGLPFAIVKFMEVLQDDDLIWWHHKNNEWAFSVSQILAETTDSSDDIAELVSTRLWQLEQLNPHTKAILSFAAVQGFRFDENMVVALAKSSLKNLDNTRSVVTEALQAAKKLSLIEHTQDDTSYEFCHHRIHECFYEKLKNGKQLRSLHITAGRILQERQNEADVFSIARHLNRGSKNLVTQDEKLNCAESNLCASNLAMRKSAFVLAAEYASLGLVQLEESVKWRDEYYPISLDLHCSAANAHHNSGNVEECTLHLETVLQNARSVDDSIRVYTIKMYSLGSQARLDEAIEIAFLAARLLGVKIPKRPTMGSAIWQIIKTKSMIGGKTDEQLLALPDCGQLKARGVFELLGTALHYASLAMKIPHLCLATTLMMQIAITGHASEPFVFASYGILENVMGNTREAVRMGHLALELQAQQGSPDATLPATFSIAHTLLLHWRTDFRDSLQPLIQANRVGMAIGDFNDAFLAIQTYLQMGFFCGCPSLLELEQQMRDHCNVMLEFDDKPAANPSLIYWQMCINLLGRNENPTILVGEAMNQISLEQDVRAGAATLTEKSIKLVRIILCYQFADLAALRVLITDISEKGDPLVGHFVQYIGPFYLGLTYIALYRSSAKRSIKCKALKVIKQIRKWTDNGCVNTVPFLALLEAELATLARPKAADKAQVAFDQAIYEAQRSENVAMEALANECAARDYKVRMGNARKSAEYMEAALELYNRWGAVAKVSHIERSMRG